MHISTIENPWGKTFTDKRYVHPPLSECIVSMWGSSMVLYGEINSKDPMMSEGTPKKKGSTLPSAGVIFTVKRLEETYVPKHELDYPLTGEFMPALATKYGVRDDGIPVHSMVKDFDDFKFYQEVFCDEQRIPITYIKVSLENGFGKKQRFVLSTLLRVGHEKELVGYRETSGYKKTVQKYSHWKKLKKVFKQQNDYYACGNYKFYLENGNGFEKGVDYDLENVLELDPYEKKTFYFALTRNTQPPKKYNVARKQTISFWQEELKKAKFIPKEKRMRKVFNNLLVQCLQMFCRRQKKDYVLIRQGGLSRLIWPTEARSVIHALSEIGGYEEYLKRAIDTYFDIMQEKKGEETGKITTFCHWQWSTNPASVLESFAYAARNDDKLFNDRIQEAMLTYDYIERERAKTQTMDGVIKGLFPPGLSSDFGGTGDQIWGHTDCWMLQGINEFLKVLKEKNSPYYERVKMGYDDYYNTLENVLKRIAEAQIQNEKIYLPHDAKNNPELEEKLNKAYVSISLKIANYLYQGFNGYDSEIQRKVFKAHFPKETNQKGFYSSVYESESGVGQVWYITFTEYTLYRYFGIIGKVKEQKRILDALLKYAVTNEYYLTERYDSHKGMIASWLPNASASGRVIAMLLDYYGKVENK